MANIILSEAVATRPLMGGSAWHALSWLRGLRRLGHRVLFVEQIASSACTDEEGRPASFEDSVNRAYLRRLASNFDLEACLVLGDGERTEGLSFDAMLEASGSADLLINITGHLRLASVLRRVRRRAYVDVDPGFTQIWHSQNRLDLDGYDAYHTMGANIGTAECTVPVDGVPWRPLRPPVVLEDWPSRPAGEPDRFRFTTVASWRGTYGTLSRNGTAYGQKAHEFRRVAELPKQTGHRFELALDIHEGDRKDRDMLESNGWRLVDPKKAAGEPEAFRSYVQASGAEFSTAQGVYVETRTGWFSDRTVKYLASGRPALVQDTGARLPAGEGLLTFRTLDEAAEGADRIAAEYERHRRAARTLAEAHFDSDKVLGRYLEEVGL